MRLFCLYIFFLLLISVSAEAQQTFHLKELPKEETLLTGWKMFAGDDPKFADPAFDDNKWQQVDLSNDLQNFPEFKTAGVIWVRLHLRMDSTVLPEQLMAHILQYSASEIYLNGEVLKKYGTVSNDPSKVIAWLPTSLPFDLPLKPGIDNVLSARLSYQKGIPYISYLNQALPTLSIFIDNKNEAIKTYEASLWETKMYIIIFSISSGTLLIIGFIYLVYFLFDKKQKLHLYYALAMLTQAMNALPVEIWGTDRTGAIGRIMWVFYFEGVAYTLSMIFILLTIYTIFNYPHRLLFKILAVLSLILVLVMYWFGTDIYFIISYIYPAVYLFAGAYACLWAMKRKKRHAGIILAGVLIYAFSTLLSAVIPVNSVSAQLMFYVSQMCFPIGMSFYLAIQNSLTNKKLRISLEEVQTLSDKNLAQEQEKQLLLSNQNVLLEQQVQSRTAELKQSLTDLKATQSQLIQAEKMASLGELTAGIAHEIQNPLNFVNNFSEVNKELAEELKEELSTGNLQSAKEIAEDLQSNSEKINHHGKRADSIVKGMLQHSKSNNGKKEPTDINALADEYLRLAYHGLRAKDKSFNAILKTEYDEAIGKINIIPQDMGRVLLNLFTNAFYAVEEKRKTLSAASAPTAVQPATTANYEPAVNITTKKIENRVFMSVSDNGNGIPNSIIDKILQPFFTTKPTGQGTGLGLSLAYDIVKAHGGELKVETTENESTTFIIHLPINQ